jgi:hydroxypyruvate isomerase
MAQSLNGPVTQWSLPMPRFAANISMMFTEVEFLDRFARAAAAGFEAVEFLFPYRYKPEEVAQRLNDNGLSQALFNMPPGDWDSNDRGLASIPGREDEFAGGINMAMEYAEALNCPRLHVMAGVPGPEVDAEKAWATYVNNLRAAAQALAPAGRDVMIEPINTRDIPGFFLNRQAEGRRAIEEAGMSNIGLQLDLYHCQIVEGDLAVHIDDYADITRHIQIAGVPERHEPDVGELNYPYLFERIDASGYTGWIGCEYRPRGTTEEGLGWFAPYRPR